MKNYLLLIITALALSASALAQASASAAPDAGAETAKPKELKRTPTMRERFDPARDPRADLAAAVGQALKAGKNIILDVGGEWCGWCVYMDKFFADNPEIAKLRDQNYVWVKVNFSEKNKNKEFLAVYPEALGYPHLYVLDPSGKLLQSQDTSELEMGKGYNPDKFTEFLKKWSPASPAKAASSN